MICIRKSGSDYTATAITQTTPVVPGVNDASDGSSTLPASMRKKRQSWYKIGAFFNEINPFRICEMPFWREILLRNVKYALRRVDLFHFTESDSFLFHNLRSKLFHINKFDISNVDNLQF